MSIFTKLLGVAADFIPGGGLIKTGLKIAAPIMASAFRKPATKLIAGGIAGAGISTAMARVTTGGTSMSYPIGNLPSLPSLAGIQTAQMQQNSPGGLPVPFWKGPGGKLQMPWNDPRVPEYLKQFALDDAYLKTYYRAPKGYVIIKDANGRPYAVNKAIARQFGLWKPAAKPPISATDYKHYKRNKVIEKKLKKIAAPLIRKSASRAAASPSKRK